MINFINAKDCYRQVELDYYNDKTYLDSSIARPTECCSLYNGIDYIPLFRLLTEGLKGNTTFEAWITKELEQWREKKALEIISGSIVPALGSFILPDSIIKKIGPYPKLIYDKNDGLDEVCRPWPEFHQYRSEILTIYLRATTPEGLVPIGGEVSRLDRDRINKKQISRRKIQPVPLLLNPAEAALVESREARLERKNTFLIKNGHGGSLPKPVKTKTKLKALSQNSSSQGNSPTVSSQQLESQSSVVGGSSSPQPNVPNILENLQSPLPQSPVPSSLPLVRLLATASDPEQTQELSNHRSSRPPLADLSNNMNQSMIYRKGHSSVPPKRGKRGGRQMRGRGRG